MSWDPDAGSLDFTTLREAYGSGRVTPEQVVRAVYTRIARRNDDHVWIALVPEAEAVARARDLAQTESASLALYGLPFAVKDNIDLAGLPTTAGCPAFAYQPRRSATAVERLMTAGAIPVGKTNLDQFATGLLGTLSPYGAVSSVFHRDYISGGSSSGSAVAVAAGLASFALGTDTAGSGRVPAAFNNLVGLKPTRGLISAAGLVPACKTLDCVSVFAMSCDDAWDVVSVMRGFDRRDPFSRRAPDAPTRLPQAAPVFRFGVPAEPDLTFCGDGEAERLYRAALDRLERLGGQRVRVDYAPFAEVAQLLYGGPWVAERYAGIVGFIAAHPDALYPVTRKVIEGATRHTAVEAFLAQYRLAELHAATVAIWETIDFLALPTTPTILRHDQVADDPVARSRDLGTYTNFVNLLDLAAIAIPVGIDARGLPAGLSLIGPAFSDARLAAVGDALHRGSGVSMGATGHYLPSRPARAANVHGHALVVVGAHLSGMALNHELLALGATFLRATRTAPRYRLHALSTTAPSKPGLQRVAVGGASIDVEVWDLPAASVGPFLAGIAAPLGLGQIELEDGGWVTGFTCEPWGLSGAVDITRFGGWRQYRAAHGS